jgi:hypothetical protein
MTIPLLTMFLGLSGCADHEYGGVFTTLQVSPEEIYLYDFQEDHQTTAGLGRLEPIRIFASDEMTSRAQEYGSVAAPYVEVSIYSQYPGVYVIPAEAIETEPNPFYVDLDGDGSYCDDYRELCLDDDGDVKPNAEEWCYYSYCDGDSYWTLSDSYMDAAGYDPLTDPNICTDFEVDSDGDGENDSCIYGPTFATAETDERGMLDAYIFIDYMPEGGTGSARIQIIGGGSKWLPVDIFVVDSSAETQ